MGGDVFGNGLLYSRKFRLLAAFNHKYIFLDPDPDPEKSFQERERLFYADNSDWDSYNPGLISGGGGVYLRNEKSISVSAQAREKLGIEQEQVSGQELVRAILKAPVELLYNGGIGTYVKSSEEDNQDVGDVANNEVRINGNEIRAAIACEGGNLGFTQNGRIEYALHGGDIYTDALDNSGGVDLSDHEVNLKIFFNSIHAPREQRNSVMQAIAPDVVQNVLLNNNLQSLAVNVEEYESENAGWEKFILLSEYLKNKNILHPQSENIPADRNEWQSMNAKSKKIPKPILCVLFGYAKMDLYKEAVESGVLQYEKLPRLYREYFPVKLQQDYDRQLEMHPLRTEILVTQAVNFYINLLGCRGILLFAEYDVQNRMQRFSDILQSLYDLELDYFIRESALLRDMENEPGLYQMISSIRDVIWKRWSSDLSTESISNNPVSQKLSQKSISLLMNLGKKS